MPRKKTISLSAVVRYLLYISPFVFPLYLIKFQVYGIPFTVLEVFIYVLFALWLFGLVFRKFPFNWKDPLYYYWLAVFALFLGSTIGILTAPHYIDLPSGEILDSQKTALGVWKGWVVAPMLYFAVLTQSFKLADEVKKLSHLFIYSGGLIGLIAYGMVVFGYGLTYDFRLSGFYESANYLSLYLVPPLLLSIYFFFKRSHLSKMQIYLNLASLLVMAHALYFTQSYAAIIGVFGSIILYVLYLMLKKSVQIRKIIFGLFVLAITFSVIILTQINTPKFQQFLDWENRSSTSVRLEIYEVAWSLINEEPLTGIGPGLFQAEYQTRGRENLGRIPMEWNIPHPHNIFFAFWLNAGLLGLLSLFAFLILSHFRFTYPLLALWGIVIHGFFDTPFWKNDLSMIFWLVLGSIVILQMHETPKKRKKPIRKMLTPKVSHRVRG
ncbi:O-antigen ligase family protein [Patescibacteria group bacterium]|nr:O-antigen ligase family protein [Patescibacteria group bacterium]MBU1682426.1 O-antigen ligase family protein [Patescibacteria group bacterium]MBU1934863.1 O-antigen ligase family protein [Patescibacteria group bacterium]